MVEVLKSGIFDTIQDMGRIGFQEFGVPMSGVMDRYASSIANAILGNPADAAVMELTALGPRLKFHQDTVICVSGAQMHPRLNTFEIDENVAVAVTTGDILSFGPSTSGFRAYLAVRGGFQTECAMQSRSMYLNVSRKARLSKGDFISILPLDKKFKGRNSSLHCDQSYIGKFEMDVFKGPEFEGLHTDQKDLIFNQEFTISKDSNRMAYQLEELVENQLDPILTSLVLPGTVQLTPSGRLVILMRDAQTTGGYPRVLQLSEASINSLSQKGIGKRIRFKCKNW